MIDLRKALGHLEAACSQEKGVKQCTPHSQNFTRDSWSSQHEDKRKSEINYKKKKKTSAWNEFLSCSLTGNFVFHRQQR